MLHHCCAHLFTEVYIRGKTSTPPPNRTVLETLATTEMGSGGVIRCVREELYSHGFAREYRLKGTYSLHSFAYGLFVGVYPLQVSVIAAALTWFPSNHWHKNSGLGLLIGGGA
ncbi:hypothetical protein F2P79_005648 [Pimephales promelas]|nr:hypothetical protein F2P79_005648 [Pimephales promelas]